MGGWDDADMGTWNDNAQQTNSSWNSATGWNKDKRTNVKVYSSPDQGIGHRCLGLLSAVAATPALWLLPQQLLGLLRNAAISVCL